MITLSDQEHEEQIAKIRAYMETVKDNPQLAFESLVRIGILKPTGELAEPYDTVKSV